MTTFLLFLHFTKHRNIPRLNLPTEAAMHLHSRAYRHNWESERKAMEARVRWANAMNAAEGRVRHRRTRAFSRRELREIERAGL